MTKNTENYLTLKVQKVGSRELSGILGNLQNSEPGETLLFPKGADDMCTTARNMSCPR